MLPQTCVVASMTFLASYSNSLSCVASSSISSFLVTIYSCGVEGCIKASKILVLICSCSITTPIFFALATASSSVVFSKTYWKESSTATSNSSCAFFKTSISCDLSLVNLSLSQCNSSTSFCTKSTFSYDCKYWSLIFFYLSANS